MEVILKQDIATLGYVGDVIKVKPGYGRNYLIPQGLAVTASPSNLKIVQENQKQAAHKIAKVKEDAQNLADKLGKAEINIKAKTGTSGKIFGSITTLQVAQALKDQGFDIDRRKITLSGDIKEIGEYTANIDLHREVKATVPLKVTGDQVAQ